MSTLSGHIDDIEIVSSSSPAGEMSLTVVSGNDLSPLDRKAWVDIQENNQDLRNPFFRLEFTESLAKVRPTVKVAILKRGNVPFAFWPYQENSPGIATPVGEKIGCMHGVICKKGLKIDGGAFARLCGLKAWRFDHLLSSQEIFAPYYYGQQESPYMDLSNGFEAYCADRRAKGHSNRVLSELGRKCRRMERDLGSLRLEVDCRDLNLLEHLVEWKKQQMKDTGRRDLFVQSPWVMPLVENSIRMENDAFRGLLSVLYLNDEPISIHFAFRSYDYLHGIFFAFNREYSKYSPGMALVLQLVQQANDFGINRIDMGKGDERYKQMWKSDATSIAVGGFEGNPFSVAMRRPLHSVKRRVGRSWVGAPLKRTVATIQRLSDSSHHS